MESKNDSEDFCFECLCFECECQELEDESEIDFGDDPTMYGYEGDGH